jgi:predicted phosphodiesterase
MNMKLKLNLLTCLFCFIFLTGSCTESRYDPEPDNTEEPDDTTPIDNEEELPQFIVISDTHFGNNRGEGPMVKVPKALKNLTGKAPKADAVFVVGDLTNDGTIEQYDQLLSVFGNKSNIPENMPVYFLMGNHDNFSNNGQLNYTARIKQPLNQYITIKGYPFITISETGSDQNDYDIAAQNFLRDKMATAAKDFAGKPIFVFIHVPTNNTSYGSNASGALADGGWSTNVFRSILDKYPQAVVFSGHTHYPLGDPRSIHQDKFTAVNTASTTYSEVEPGLLTGGTLPTGYENITEGLIVTVKENGNVELERRNTYQNKEIEPKWLLTAPHDGSKFTYKNRTGGEAPKFGNSAKPEIRNISASGCNVTFPQASDDEAVHHYKVEILEGTTVIASNTIFSGFYLNSQMPATLTVYIGKLSAQKTYTARVTAYDSYRNASQVITSEQFQL